MKHLNVFVLASLVAMGKVSAQQTNSAAYEAGYKIGYFIGAFLPFLILALISYWLYRYFNKKKT